MNLETLTLESRNHVLWIGLNRPEQVNAFDLQMFADLASAYGHLERDSNLRCGVVFAHGKHFTAGIDLELWAPLFAAGTYPNIPTDGLDPFGLVPDRICSKPLIMAVQGLCLTIGIELMLAADIRIAASHTRFGQIEVSRGVYPVGGGTIRWIQEVGWGNAMRYLLTGEEFRAKEALRMGLVQEVVPAEQLLHRAGQLADRISEQAPLGVAATLNSARLARSKGERAAIEQLLPDLRPLMASADAQEGVLSFTERRAANFRGQ
jgi:enoyl-CoA hydratase/carnithine racemase